MTQTEFNQALAEKKAREEAIASSFAGAPDEEIPGLLLEFLCCKYLLHPEEIRSENLIQLGEQSTAKIAGIQSSGIEFREKSAGCTTASSGVIKKILLAMAVGKCIGVKLDPDQVAAAETVSQLADLMIKTRRNR